ncbi:hypothetical protein FRC06_009788 [Ceratobasidium sp. 370]|nr:hypothetical protein FRC06_009788 [Ceratobasidium sp. 370]
MTPGQFIPFQQHFIHDQPAPQTVATAPLAAPAAPAIPIDSAAPTFLDASAAPQAVAASPTVLSSEPLPSNVSAVHVFEANVVFNNECRSAGLHTWNEIENDITNHRPTESPIQLVANWEEPLLYMSKQDFRAYYYKQHKLARACKMTLPQLPEWVSKFAFSEKDLAKHSPLPTDRAAAQAILKRSLRGSASSKPEVGSKSKGKGKARATPYTRTGSSLRPSTLGRS